MNALRLGLGVASLLFLFAPVRGDGHAPLTPYDQIALQNQLKSIFVSVDFKDATIGQVTDALVEKYRQAGYHRNVQFYLAPQIRSLSLRVTLKLDNVPLGVALHYACELAHLRYQTGDDIINIYPQTWGEDGMVSRTFHVDPSFVENVQQVIPPSKLSQP